MSKKSVMLIFGGYGPEYEISISSAIGIFNHIDKDKFDVVPIIIAPDGWFKVSKNSNIWSNTDALPNFIAGSEDIDLRIELSELQYHPFGAAVEKPDIIFPIIHGDYGEDGVINGVLQILYRSTVPVIGPTILGNSSCYDKEFCKRVLECAGIKTAPYVVVDANNKDTLTTPSADGCHPFKVKGNDFGYPVYVKASSSGSSRGVSRVENESELASAIEDSFKYSDKVIVEKAIEGHEIECAVLSTSKGTECAVPGEITKDSVDGFYSFDAKYTRPVKTLIPANIPQEQLEQCQEIAIKAFDTLELKGLSRVDLLVDNTGIYVNEINTLPGFTPISMFPKLWEYEGLSYTDLITTLIEFELTHSSVPSVEPDVGPNVGLGTGPSAVTTSVPIQ
jgi:D-alanine-D-alanine ligase